MPDLTILTEQRMEMLSALVEKPKTEVDVVEETQLNASTVTRGLRHMAETGFVEKLTEINGITLSQNVYELTDSGKQAVDLHSGLNSNTEEGDNNSR